MHEDDDRGAIARELFAEMPLVFFLYLGRRCDANFSIPESVKPPKAGGNLQIRPMAHSNWNSLYGAPLIRITDTQMPYREYYRVDGEQWPKRKRNEIRQ